MVFRITGGIGILLLGLSMAGAAGIVPEPLTGLLLAIAGLALLLGI